ncbi:MAG: dihydrodipicolinate reductase [Rhodobacteraceae bacterium]|nr:dihydrodipicolinate reductase [Paracoccaceae bacterium]
MARILLAVAALIALAATPLRAEGFHTIESRSGFLGLVDGRSLTRTGVSLAVTPGGEIIGQAFGRPITGAWRWDGRYFCRDMSFGTRKLGQNCHLVQVRGRVLRFIGDRGAGDRADLRLD